MNSFYSGKRRIGTIHLEVDHYPPILEFKMMFEEGVAALNQKLADDEVLHIHLDDDDEYVVPTQLRKAFGEEPVMIFFYLNEHGCHLTLKRASSENAPLFRSERVGDKIRVYSLNDEARDILVTLMGNGARAIIKGEHGPENFYVTPECRPSGLIPEEMYQVSYKVHAGKPEEYTDRETCKREELMEFIENPHYTELEITVV